MQELFARLLSQGLQAFMPVAVCAAWLRHAEPRLRNAVRWALAAAIPSTVILGRWFEHSSYQARWQSVLALAGAAIAILCTRQAWRERPTLLKSTDVDRLAPAVALGAATLLIFIRQAIEIAAVFDIAVIQTRSLDATEAICAGVAVAFIAAVAWRAIATRLPVGAIANATRAFAVLFLAQIAFFAFHKSAEARFLPWGEMLDNATEPFGPDSVFGYRVSYLLFGVPLAAGMLSLAARRWSAEAWRTSRRRIARPAFMVFGAVMAVFLAATAMTIRGLTPPASSNATASDIAGIASGPHVLLRETGLGDHYGMLSLVPLSNPGSARAATSMACERVSFGGGRGICLQAERGVFTTYRAVMFDEHFQIRGSLKLDGSPSRTRISADGRVGAITVFVTGATHGYTSTSFSTKTVLLDMTGGDVLGDLEQFNTWRDGQRFHAADFNFWGVTFARDSNTFYASLRTAGQTYLVRGDLALRKLTVLHENVECPSLSPNNRLIAYKKKVAMPQTLWRFYLMDVNTMQERPLALETRSIDDQIEWLDDAHVLYATPRSAQTAVTDVWKAPIDGSAPPSVFIQQAESPLVVH